MKIDPRKVRETLIRAYGYTESEADAFMTLRGLDKAVWVDATVPNLPCEAFAN